jgi:arylsulfatase A
MFWFYYAALTEPKAALREGDWKLVAHWDVKQKLTTVTPDAIQAIKHAKLTEFELYNLREDVGEKHDLAQQQTVRVESMGKELRALFSQLQKEGSVWPAASAGKNARKAESRPG